MKNLENKADQNRLSIRSALLLFGCIGILSTLLYKSRHYYLGEELVERKITISEPTVYIQAGRSGTSRYELDCAEYEGKLWLSGTVLDLVRQNNPLEDRIKTLKYGDII